MFQNHSQNLEMILNPICCQIWTNRIVDPKIMISLRGTSDVLQVNNSIYLSGEKQLVTRSQVAVCLPPAHRDL